MEEHGLCWAQRSSEKLELVASSGRSRNFVFLLQPRKEVWIRRIEWLFFCSGRIAFITHGESKVRVPGEWRVSAPGSLVGM